MVTSIMIRRAVVHRPRSILPAHSIGKSRNRKQRDGVGRIVHALSRRNWLSRFRASMRSRALCTWITNGIIRAARRPRVAFVGAGLPLSGRGPSSREITIAPMTANSLLCHQANCRRFRHHAMPRRRTGRSSPRPPGTQRPVSDRFCPWRDNITCDYPTRGRIRGQEHRSLNSE